MKRNRKIKFEKTNYDYKRETTFLDISYKQCSDSYLIECANKVLNTCIENKPYKDFELYIQGLKYDGYDRYKLIVKSNKKDFLYFAQLFIMEVGKYIEKVEF